MTINGNRSSFSSVGPTFDDRIKPDVCAPGVEDWVVDVSTTDGYRQGSGTSYAAPMTAGLVALLLRAAVLADDHNGGGPAYMVTITNLTYDQIISPPVVVVHDGRFRLFRPGQPAGEPWSRPLR